MSSGQHTRHDGFNKWQIKDGWIVLMDKSGSIKKRIEPYRRKVKINVKSKTV